MSLADIITADKQKDITDALRRQDNPVSGEAATIIDRLMEFSRDGIYLLDDLQRASRDLLKAESEIHKMYPNTATCRSAPGVVASQAFTRHCAATCNNPEHVDAKSKYANAYSKLIKALEAIDV